MDFVPLMSWDDKEIAKGDVIWWAKLDQRYQIEVQGIADRHAQLLIFDHENADALLFSETVPLAYGALFGPDIQDVEDWKDKAIAFIDARPEL